MTPTPGRDDTTAAGDHEFTEDVADASMCVCGVPAISHDAAYPAATPGRDELREQIAAARMLSREERFTAGRLAAVLEKRDPSEWDEEGVRVIFRRAAVTIQLLLRETDAAASVVDTWVAAHTAEVAVVSALCDEAERQSPVFGIVSIERVRAALDPSSPEDKP